MKKKNIFFFLLKENISQSAFDLLESKDDIEISILSTNQSKAK